MGLMQGKQMVISLFLLLTEPTTSSIQRSVILEL